MVRRAGNFDEYIAKELRKDKKFAREMVLAFLEDTPLEKTLLMFVKAYGLKEYAQLIDMDRGNLHRSLSKGNPSYRTLQKILNPLGLSVGVVEKKKKRKRKAA